MIAKKKMFVTDFFNVCLGSGDETLPPAGGPLSVCTSPDITELVFYIPVHFYPSLCVSVYTPRHPNLRPQSPPQKDFGTPRLIFVYSGGGSLDGLFCARSEGNSVFPLFTAGGLYPVVFVLVAAGALRVFPFGLAPFGV